MIYFDLPELPRTVTADNGPGSTGNAPKQNEKRHNRYHADYAFGNAQRNRKQILNDLLPV
jgi:hypothetical protein